MVEKIIITVVQYDAVLGRAEHGEGGEILAPLQHVDSLLNRLGKISVRGLSTVEVPAEISDIGVVVLLPVGVLAVIVPVAVGILTAEIQVGLSDPTVEIPI